METLITIGVVIYILVSIRKAMSYGKDKTGAKKPAPGGWQEKLQEMARQIKEEMEKAQREAQGLPPVPAPAPPSLPDVPARTSESESLEWGSLEEDVEPLAMEDQMDEEFYSLESQEPGDPIKQDTGPGPVAQDVVTEKTWVGIEGRKPRQIKFRRDELKRALIWSEILGKPLSLRD